MGGRSLGIHAPRPDVEPVGSLHRVTQTSGLLEHTKSMIQLTLLQSKVISMKIKPIKTESDYEAALKDIE